MTKLERLWDDFPTGRPPVEAVLREARRTASVRRRRVRTRPLIAATALTALGLAFAAGTLVSGRGPSTPLAAPPPVGPRPAAFQADLPAAQSCGQLLSAYVDRGLGLVTAWGWQAPVYRGPGPVLPNASGSAKALQNTTDGLYGTAPGTVRQTNSPTGTNVQEAAVDEPDTVKTDGSVLVRARHSELQVYDLTGTRPRWVGSLPLPQLTGTELLLSGDTVVALGADRHSPDSSRVVTISIADPTHPQVTGDVGYASQILSARQHGTAVRLVLSAGLPDLGFVQPSNQRSVKEALAANRRLVQGSTIGDWLPTYTTGGSAQPLLACTDVAIPPAEVGLGTVSIVGFDAATPDRVDAIGLAGATTTAYASADDLYLATTPEPAGCGPGVFCPLMAAGGVRSAPTRSTYVFDFALDGTAATHVATGRVDGTIADRWSMDSVDGSLRVAVQPWAGGTTSIETFRREGQQLVEEGHLGSLGNGESMQAVRWFDGLAIVVTYRQVDPLYAVDLTDPARPRLLGRLSVPGYSAYLHPLGPDRMIGVGRGPGPGGRWGAQVGLFDVADLHHVRRLAVLHFASDSYPLAGSDPRTFTWLQAHRTALTVIARGRDAYLSVLRVQDGRLHDRLLRVGSAGQAAQVRTLPVPGGRVVLVAGDRVSLLRLR